MSDNNQIELEKGQVATAIELEAMRRDLGTVSESIREVATATEREFSNLQESTSREFKSIRKETEERHKNQRSSLIAIIGILVPVMLAVSMVLLDAIGSNEEKILNVGEMLRNHEIEAAYHRGLMEGRLNEHDRDIQEIRHDRELINRMVQKMHGIEGQSHAGK